MIFPRPFERLSLSKRRKASLELCFSPARRWVCKSHSFFCFFFFSSLFSCPGIFPWPDEFLNKNMVRREQERGGKPRRGHGEKSLFKTRVISSGNESLGCVFNLKIPTNFKPLY